VWKGCAQPHDEASGERTGKAVQKGYLANREKGCGGGVDSFEGVDMTEAAKKVKTGEVYRPKGLLAFTTAAREYVRML